MFSRIWVYFQIGRFMGLEPLDMKLCIHALVVIFMIEMWKEIIWEVSISHVVQPRI